MNLKGRMANLIQTIKNDYGRFIGKGSCYGCYDSWGWKKYHVIQYSDSYGMFPYCEECHKTLSEDRKKELADRLITRWMSNNYWGRDWNAIRNDVHNAIEAGQ